MKKIEREKVNMSVYIKISKVLDIFVNYYICKKQKVNLGKYSKICGRIYIENRNPDKEKHISIGDNTIINSGIHKNPIGGNIQTLLVTNPGGRIYIGNNVGMSNVAIFAQEAVVIEDYVMIGGEYVFMILTFIHLIMKPEYRLMILSFRQPQLKLVKVLL